MVYGPGLDSAPPSIGHACGSASRTACFACRPHGRRQDAGGFFAGTGGPDRYRCRGASHPLYFPAQALAVDVQRNLLTPIAEMKLDIRVETRTGDTPSDRKARQRVRPPQILLTTPESLSLLLSHARSDEHTSELQSLMRISYAVIC